MKLKLSIFLLGIYFSFNAFAKTLSVDITYSGNDALTKSLETELKIKVSHSKDFTFGKSQRSDLQLLIIDDVNVKKIANHNQVSYKVSFISQQKLISVSAGSCWQEQIYECADQILRDAKITIRP